MEIRELKNSEKDKWDDFVLRQKNSTIFQLCGWKDIIEESYNNQTYYLVAENAGEIEGLLPLVSFNSKIFGNKLISMPFVYSGGVCTESSIASEKLIEKAIKIAKDINSDYLELRNIYEDMGAKSTNTSFVTSTLELKPDPEDVYSLLSKNKRKNIKRTEKENLSASWNSDISNFYRLYAHNMRDLGTPVHSIQFFSNILKFLPGRSRILSVQRNGEVVYSALFLIYKDIIMDFMSSTIEEYRRYNPTDYGIWEAIKYACENGYKYFDFARSIKDSSNQEFKRRWSAESKQLYYQYYFNKGNIPNYDISNKKYQLPINMWRKMPIKATKILGPKIRKNIP